MRFIGDIHGKVSSYVEKVRDVPRSIQLGDFGKGFLNDIQERHLAVLRQNGDHRFIRGNHDDPSLCAVDPCFIPDGYYDQSLDIMHIGGAWSIDWQYRVAGVDWWPDEEINLYQMQLIADEFARIKPSIVVSHDAPTNVTYSMFCARSHKPHYITSTGTALQEMFDRHAPDVWLFGHWHTSARYKLGATEFICLDELETLDISINQQAEAA